MHIVFLSARVPPAVDGVGDYSAFLAAALLRRGVRVTLACGEQDLYIPPSGIEFRPGALQQARREPARWAKSLAANRADWLLLHYVPYAFHRLGLPLFLPALLRHVRSEGIRVGAVFHEVHIRPAEKYLLSLGQQWVVRQLGQHIDWAVTSIPLYRDMLAALGITADVLAVGANIEVRCLSKREREQMRARHFPNKRFVVGTFGRRDVRALAAAVARRSDAVLLAIGAADGGDCPNLHRTGYLPSSEVCAWLQCCDVFALPDPLTPEGTGGTSLKSGSLAAAFAAGLPVMGVRGDMTAPPLLHGENIWLIDAPTPEGWENALSYLRSRPALLRHLAQGGEALYRQQLDWDVVASAFFKRLNS